GEFARVAMTEDVLGRKFEQWTIVGRSRLTCRGDRNECQQKRAGGATSIVHLVILSALRKPNCEHGDCKRNKDEKPEPVLRLKDDRDEPCETREHQRAFSLSAVRCPVDALPRSVVQHASHRTVRMRSELIFGCLESAIRQ